MNSSYDFLVALTTWQTSASHLGALRREVFVLEQAVPESLEMDGRDEECVHALAEDLAGMVIGTARLLPEGRIGRVAVRQDWRGRGVGAALMRALMEAADSRGLPVLELHAQSWTVAFYEKLGFVAEGEEFEEAGILHRAMFLRR